MRVDSCSCGGAWEEPAVVCGRTIIRAVRPLGGILGGASCFRRLPCVIWFVNRLKCLVTESRRLNEPCAGFRIFVRSRCGQEWRKRNTVARLVKNFSGLGRSFEIVHAKRRNRFRSEPGTQNFVNVVAQTGSNSVHMQAEASGFLELVVEKSGSPRSGFLSEQFLN